jgi:4-amino-4-deoxy-L-arabinose transferase-like glycosyltransferase
MAGMSLTLDPALGSSRSATPAQPWWMSVWTVLAVGLAIYVIRMMGPEDLADFYHQERAAAYVMDVLRNGNWICQYGYYGEVTSKPPMLTWLAALASLPFPQANWFSLSLPGALATIGLAVLIFSAGSRYFGRAAGFLGALVYLLSPIGAKQMVLVRIDGLFSLTVAVTALLAFNSWQTGRGWIWFWLAGAVATLTKGPLGVLLGGMGLLATVWEKRTGNPAPIKGRHLPGVVLYFVICGGWLALAYAAVGQPLIDIMLGRELVGQMVKSSRGPAPFVQFYLPTTIFLTRWAPWSLLAVVGFWQAFKRPSADPSPRRMERFLTCWFLGGLIVFSCAAHQRPDLIFPLIPPAAIIVGKVLSGLLATRPRLTRWLVPIGAAAALVLVYLNYLHGIDDRIRVQRTEAIKRIARGIKAAGGTTFPVTYNHQSPYGLQFYLNTKRLPVDATWSARLLADKPDVFIATSDIDSIRKALGTNPAEVYVLDTWRGSKQEAVDIISNHPRLEWTDDMHWVAKPCLFRLINVDDVGTYANEFRFDTKAPEASVIIKCIEPVAIRVKDLNSGVEKELKRNEAWEVKFSGRLKLIVSPAGRT